MRWAIIAMIGIVNGAGLWKLDDLPVFNGYSILLIMFLMIFNFFGIAAYQHYR